LKRKDCEEVWLNKDNAPNINQDSLHTLDDLLTDKMRAILQGFKEEETNSGGSTSNSLQTSIPLNN